MRKADWFCAAALAAAAMCGRALADAPPSPAPGATEPPRRIEVRGTVRSVFWTQGASGPGLAPVEGPSFAQGGAAAPVTPYDPFSAAPLVPGNFAQEQATVDALYRATTFSVGARLGAEAIFGDRTSLAYWGEPLAPMDDPHLGTDAARYPIVFPTHPGSDDESVASAGIIQAHASLLHDALLVRGGWLDLAQTLPSVFAPPPATSAFPLLGMRTPESLGPGAPALDLWDQPNATLPLRGFDVVYRLGSATVEGTDAQLPSLPGTLGRLTSFSIGRFSENGAGAMVQWAHVSSGGDPISTSTLFGADRFLAITDQGVLANSTLHGQHETIAGARAVGRLAAGLTGTAEYSRSTYEADGIGRPGIAFGAFGHVALAYALGDASVAAHYYRFDPTFATMVLPYGIPENIWSVAYSWPGPWLKSDYQLVDSSTIGVNREGPMFAYQRDTERSKTDVAYADFRQIAPYVDAPALGFVEGFFLVEPPGDATLGRFRRASGYFSRRLGAADVSVDVVDDRLYRAAAMDVPFDAVSFDAPQYVVSVSQAGTRRAFSAGIAYYGMRGSWADGAATNVDFGTHAIFAGEQIAERGAGAVMVAARRTRARGAPYFGAVGVAYASPDFTATSLLVEQRYRI